MKIVIVGGGPVGLATALALHSERVSDDVLILEAEARNTKNYSDRNIALSAASWRFLARQGLTVPADQQALIREVEVTQQGAFGLLRLCADDVNEPMLGAAVPYSVLKAALDDAVEKNNIKIRYSARVHVIEPMSSGALVALQSAECLQADCVVLADGTGSNDMLPQLKRFERDSGQIAVLTRLKANKPRLDTAFERFTTSGALALIPRVNGDYTMVWSCSKPDAERLLQMDDALFTKTVNEAFGSSLGQLNVITSRTNYRLVWRFVEPRVNGVVVALGNAAQSLHPVAAQGLNLGLRDADGLARLLSQYRGDKLSNVLSTYARSRALDRIASIGFSGVLAYGFDRGGWLADVPRGIGLTVLQIMPILKRQLIRRMALD